jgi:hypothetical protein
MARIAGVRLVVGLLIAGVIAVGGFFLRDFNSGGVLELRVGDCFDVPTGAETVSEVQHHPCNEIHSGEVVGLFDYPAAAGSPYPSHDSLSNFALGRCVSAFQTYTGRNPRTDVLLTVGWMLPVAEGWANGDHGVSCHILRVDDGTMTQSYRIASS